MSSRMFQLVGMFIVPFALESLVQADQDFQIYSRVILEHVHVITCHPSQVNRQLIAR